MVMNMTPLAEPGFWRTSTRPAVGHFSPVGKGIGFGAGDDALLGQFASQEGHRVLAQCEAGKGVVLDHLMPGCHGFQPDSFVIGFWRGPALAIRDRKQG